MDPRQNRRRRKTVRAAAPSIVAATAELATLRSWVLEERCRLAAVLGTGGIGKTTLAAPSHVSARDATETATPATAGSCKLSAKDAIKAVSW